MGRLITKIAVALILVSFVSPPSKSRAADGKPLYQFFSELYQDNIGDFKPSYKKGYTRFCETYDIDIDNTANQEKYFRLLFYHKMFTGIDSYNCVKGGMLQIPYFWHWIDPNPRHKILDNQSGKLLTSKEPPEGYPNYKSHADVDRTPYIYLLDLVSEEPKYRHPDCGEFYTFGWCSEREMAFSLFMAQYGYTSKIVQEGIHVTSDFWLEFIGRSGAKTTFIVRVDNTYDRLSWTRVNGSAFDSWYDDMGKIKMVKWYNKKARSAEEQDKVKMIRLKSKAGTRIEGLVD